MGPILISCSRSIDGTIREQQQQQQQHKTIILRRDAIEFGMSAVNTYNDQTPTSTLQRTGTSTKDTCLHPCRSVSEMRTRSHDYVSSPVSNTTFSTNCKQIEQPIDCSEKKIRSTAAPLFDVIQFGRSLFGYRLIQ